MSRLATLKAATSLSDVAKLLEFKPKSLSYVLYKQPTATKYKTFEIPKRNGGQRTIKAPIDALKLLQRKSSIEDFFEDSIKSTVIDGKTFNLGDGFDREKHYSKKVFAHKVIRPKADTINFAGFRPLLRNLTAAIEEHRASIIH